jgi:peptide/nickel transport system substrate-binding protein
MVCFLVGDERRGQDQKQIGGTTMKWKRVCTWLVFVASTFTLFSCAPNAIQPATQSTTSDSPKPTTAVVTTTASADKPKYGGTFIGFNAADTSAFDASTQFDLMGWQISLTNEPLLIGDWAKGPAGTGETDWTSSHLGQTKLLTGALAESWELKDPTTIYYHIRQGIHWWNKAPANGREFTADDVAWNLTTQWANPGGNFKAFFSDPSEQMISAKAIDKYTVEVKFPENKQGIQILESGCRAYMMLPELYPNQKDWKNALGTGAYMLTDYVPATSMTFKRNPDYYGVNPSGPGKGDQLPYIDSLTFLIIPDQSTQQSAFRTGKIDTLGNLTYEQYNALKTSTSYKFNYLQGYAFFSQPTGREDKPDLPFHDLKVRQAMNYAVDKVAIARDYYQGQADVMGYPYPNSKGDAPYYTPLDQLPQLDQDLIKGGDIEKAKQLLTEAGYPNGFKTEIGCTANDVDLLSVIKADLEKVNIDLTINQIETGVYYSMDRSRTWPEMWFKNSKQGFMPNYMFELRSASNDSAAFWDSPVTQKVYDDISTYEGIDDSKWSAELKAATPTIIESAFAIWMPCPYSFAVWQPWLKNYYGATTLGNFLPFHNVYYNWIDTDMKKSLGK